MVTKELLKAELENVEEEYLDVLYRIIKALGTMPGGEPASAAAEPARAEWQAFVNRTYGSMADAPIERGPQGELEVREPFD